MYYYYRWQIPTYPTSNIFSLGVGQLMCFVKLYLFINTVNLINSNPDITLFMFMIKIIVGTRTLALSIE